MIVAQQQFIQEDNVVLSTLHPSLIACVRKKKGAALPEWFVSQQF